MALDRGCEVGDSLGNRLALALQNGPFVADWRTQRELSYVEINDRQGRTGEHAVFAWRDTHSAPDQPSDYHC
jgi:hypothetical protein